MAETWRNRPGLLLACYLVLDVAALACFTTCYLAWLANRRHELSAPQAQAAPA